MTPHVLNRTALVLLAALGAGAAASSAHADCTYQWLPSPGGTDQPITAMTLLSNGNVVVGGGRGQVPDGSQPGVGLGSIEGSPVNRVAQWNGSSWSGLGSGLFDPPAYWAGGTGPGYPIISLFQDSTGRILAGGIDFALTSGGPKEVIGSFDGSSWNELSPNIVPAFYPFTTDQQFLGGTVVAIAQLPPIPPQATGDLIVSGGAIGAYFNNTTVYEDPTNGSAAHYLLRFDGTNWTDLAGNLGVFQGGGGDANICLAIATLPNGSVVVGGGLAQMNGVPGANGIAVWDGQSLDPDSSLPLWSPLGQGVDGGNVYAILPVPNPVDPTKTDIIIGGTFNGVHNADGSAVAASKVARWDGRTQTWSPLGAGFPSDGVSFVTSLARMPNGDIIAAGNFVATADGTPVYRIARWDGSQWNAMDGGLDTNVTTVQTVQHGIVNALVVTADGTLWVGGDFATAGSANASSPFLARWGCAAAPSGLCCRGCICDSSLTNPTDCNNATNPPARWSDEGTSCNTSGNYSSPCCSADYDKNNAVNVSDIFAFLRGWFAHSLFADANQSGGTPDVSDIFTFLRAWFSTNGHCSTTP